MFASRTPEQVGCTCYVTDPSTWFVHYGAVEPGSQMEPNYECFEHFPHTQHNSPNPILVEFRVAADQIGLAHALGWFTDALSADLTAPEKVREVIREASDAERDHARRVVSGLGLLAHGLLV